MPRSVAAASSAWPGHGAQRGRDRDAVDAVEVRGVVAARRTGCRPRRAAACTGDGASASQPSTMAPAWWSRSAAPGRARAGDADDVDPLAALDHRLAPRRQARRRGRAPRGPTRACCRRGRAARCGARRRRCRRAARPPRTSARPASRRSRRPARRCRSPRPPGARPGSASSAPVVIASATSADTAPTRSMRSPGTSSSSSFTAFE